MNNYPIEEKDNIGRVIKVIYDDKKVVHKKYWGNTSNLKVIYNIFYSSSKIKDVVIDAFDKKGNIIINFSNVLGVRILIPGFNIEKANVNGDVKFSVTKENVEKWKKIIKSS